MYDNKIVLITGAGNGIGRSTGVAFGNAGATVILVDCNGAGRTLHRRARWAQ